MTARFLLHLRRFEAKRESLRTEDRDIEGESIVFGRNPNATSSTAHSSSYVDEFGEDPVRRARTKGHVGVSSNGRDTQGEIVEESRV